ncbi:diguanylate cyclase [Ectopseudomonas mendocina]|uniref:Diguanylate cyclase n=1 Tax=Ectopseudomonas mendocina TaxID=300 RepID=A0ABD7RMQ1_ECTME|nr:diguanylate cyclase [Pseudomonas mendocina]TRO10527.1 diguanylate cyclase [Pseudomonas mendocina]
MSRRPFTHPIEILGHSLVVSASLGAAIAPKDGQCTNDLIMHADLAMYRANESLPRILP